MKKVRDLVPDQYSLDLDFICFTYKFDDALSKKKPHEFDSEELKKLIKNCECVPEEVRKREYSKSESMHMRMQADVWAPAVDWKFSAPITREVL